MISCLVSPCSSSVLQVLHQVADGKIGRVALAVVAVFLAGLERLDVGGGNGFGAVAETFESAMHQLFVLPGQAAEQQRGIGALFLRERLLLRSFEMMDIALDEPGFPLQAGALFREPLLDRRPRRTSRSGQGRQTAWLSVRTV